MTSPELSGTNLELELDLEQLGVEAEDLIYRFRNTLAELPKFQKSLALDYLAAGATPLKGTSFVLGDKYYEVSYEFFERKGGIDNKDNQDVERLVIKKSNRDGEENIIVLETVGNLKTDEYTIRGIAKSYTSATINFVEPDDKDRKNPNLNRPRAIEKTRAVLKELQEYQESRDINPESSS